MGGEGDGRGGEGGEREGKGREIKTPLLNGLPTGLQLYNLCRSERSCSISISLDTTPANFISSANFINC